MKKSGNQAIPKTIDEYLQAVPSRERAVLEKLRKTVKAVVPAAEETISYQMPAFRYHGMLVFFAAFSDHCSFFPGPSAINKFTDELKGYSTNKGTIRFTAQKPLPVALVKKIVAIRAQENETKSLARVNKKKTK